MIKFKVITRDNFNECIKLSIYEDQKDFIATNIYSLAQAKAQIDYIPLANDNDEKRRENF